MQLQQVFLQQASMLLPGRVPPQQCSANRGHKHAHRCIREEGKQAADCNGCGVRCVTWEATRDRA